MERVLDHVVGRYDSTELKQNLIAGVLDAVPFYGAPLIRQWQDRATPYPEGLATAVVNRHATIDHFWRWEMLLHRQENLVLLYQSFAQGSPQASPCAPGCEPRVPGRTPSRDRRCGPGAAGVRYDPPGSQGRMVWIGTPLYCLADGPADAEGMGVLKALMRLLTDWVMAE